MSATGTGRIVALALVLAVAAYFAIGCTLSLEYVDEGQILYASWLTGLGAVPYRDFEHLYGLSLFAVNGALLSWFDDLLAIRISLVVLKAVLVVLTYALSRHVASRPFALLACAVLVAVWGTPWWVFNAPYANHYSLTLIVAGLLCFLTLRRRFRLACLLAGLCFGLAATFKHTSALFALAAFALFLILAHDELERTPLHDGPALPGWCVRGLRLAMLIGMLAVFAVYLSPRNTLWNVAMLFTPAVATIGYALVRELRAPLGPGMQAGVSGTVYAGIGAVPPLLGVVLFFAAHGALADFYFNLISGLPQMFSWFDPLPVPTLGAVLVVAAMALVFATVSFARFRLQPSPGLYWRVALVVAGLGAVALLGIWFSSARGPVIAYLVTGAWRGPLAIMWYLVPFALVWLTGLWLLRSQPPARDAASDERRLAVLLVYCNAVVTLVLLYPAADLTHIVMVLPAYVPLGAFLFERFHRAPERRRDATPAWGAPWSAAAIGGLAVALSVVVVEHLARTYLQSRGIPIELPRATAIKGQEPKFGEVAALLSYLDTNVPPNHPLLFLNGEQTLYFLAGRRSPLDKDEFALYLVTTNIISADDARALVDQQRAIAQLAALRPVVIEGGNKRTDGRVRQVFGELSRYLDAHYELTANVANYRVLTFTRE